MRSLVDNPQIPQLLSFLTTAGQKAGKKDRIEIFA
jgi:hypothetical protein